MKTGNLDANGLVDFDREVANNESWPLSVDEIANKYLGQPVETIEDGSSHEDEVLEEPISKPSRSKIDEALEILNTLTLFTIDLGIDLLLQSFVNIKRWRFRTAFESRT